MTRLVSARVGVPFLLAVTGVLFMLGLVIHGLLGGLGLGAYLVLLIAPATALLVGAAGRRSRRVAGRTCTCCTGTVHDPVQVV